MGQNIVIMQGRCHVCKEVFVVISALQKGMQKSKKAKHWCPLCNSEKVSMFSGVGTIMELPDEDLKVVSDILCQHAPCAECARPLPMLSQSRVDLTFEFSKLIDEDRGEYEEWKKCIPFCDICAKHPSESLFRAVRKYMEAEEEDDYTDVRLAKDHLT